MEFFNTKTGVQQGCILLAFLFVLVMDLKSHEPAKLWNSMEKIHFSVFAKASVLQMILYY